MKKTAFPSDQQDKFMLRLPDGMRDKVKAAAEAHNRSMNAEIVYALELYLKSAFKFVSDRPVAPSPEALENLRRAVEAMQASMGAEESPEERSAK